MSMLFFPSGGGDAEANNPNDQVAEGTQLRDK